MAVIMAGHLDDLVPARDPARHPHHRHRGLGSRRDEPDLGDRRHGRGHGLGNLDLAERGRTEARTQVERSTAAARTRGCAWPRIIGPHEPM